MTAELDPDLQAIQEARDLLFRASVAQERLGAASQEDLDRIVAAIAAEAEREAGRLAALACEETGYGNVRDKTAKNLFVARTIYQFIRPLKTVGVLREDRSLGVVEIACPKGVVAAIIPSTNPTSTAIYKILIALKAGCAIVLSPHPAARRAIAEATAVCERVALAAGAPIGAIACLSRPGPGGTDELMRNRRTGVILATGGLGLVRAAYSSGKPAFGVGPGNVPAFIERTADVEKAVRDIVTSTTFDFGTICSSEQAIVVDRPVRDQVLAELARQRAYFLTEDEVRRLGPRIITADGRVDPAAVGRAAPVVAALAGIEVPRDTTVLIAELTEVGRHVPLSAEKLCPVLALYTEDGWERGCERAIEILRHGGLGHTMAIHSRDDRVIRRFGLQKPVFRIVVNSPSTHGAIGLSTGVSPAMTLGCGALGGNITSDNITPLHLIDIKRLAYEIREVVPGAAIPGWPVGKGALPFEPPLAVAVARPPLGGAPPPPPAPGVEVGRPVGERRQGVERVVREFLDARGKVTGPAPTGAGCGRAVAPTAPSSAAAPATPASIPSAPSPPAARLTDVADRSQPVDFVCEEDVRTALAEGRQILIGPRTIVTPSARDLGRDRGAFRR